jgi:hypothetical protein
MLVKKVLDAFGENVISEAKRKSGDGNLSKSLSYKAKESKNSFEFSISMAEYGKFIDKGVTGKNDPSFKGKKKKVHRSKAGYHYGSGNFKGTGGEWKKRINIWMYSKGIAPRDKESGRFIKRDTVNFLIRRSIFQHGQKATLFLTKPFDKYFKTLPEEVLEAYALETEEFLKFALK